MLSHHHLLRLLEIHIAFGIREVQVAQTVLQVSSGPKQLPFHLGGHPPQIAPGDLPQERSSLPVNRIRRLRAKHPVAPVKISLHEKSLLIRRQTQGPSQGLPLLSAGGKMPAGPPVANLQNIRLLFWIHPKDFPVEQLIRRRLSQPAVLLPEAVIHFSQPLFLRALPLAQEEAFLPQLPKRGLHLLSLPLHCQVPCNR